MVTSSASPLVFGNQPRGHLREDLAGESIAVEPALVEARLATLGRIHVVVAILEGPVLDPGRIFVGIDDFEQLLFKENRFALVIYQSVRGDQLYPATTYSRPTVIEGFVRPSGNSRWQSSRALTRMELPILRYPASAFWRQTDSVIQRRSDCAAGAPPGRGGRIRPELGGTLKHQMAAWGSSRAGSDTERASFAHSRARPATHAEPARSSPAARRGRRRDPGEDAPPQR